MSEFARAITPMGDKTGVAGAGTPGAATPWFTTDLIVPKQCFRVTINVAPSIGTVLSYVRAGGAPIKINGGTALTAGAAFSCVIGVRPDETFNLQDSAGAAVSDLTIEGFHGGI